MKARLKQRQDLNGIWFGTTQAGNESTTADLGCAPSEGRSALPRNPLAQEIPRIPEQRHSTSTQRDGQKPSCLDHHSPAEEANQLQQSLYHPTVIHVKVGMNTEDEIAKQNIHLIKLNLIHTEMSEKKKSDVNRMLSVKVRFQDEVRR